jgi:hypothetical protein
MTTVNVTTTTNTVDVTNEAGAVVVQVTTQGPQGPVGPAVGGLGEIPDVDTTEKVDRSVLYYNAATARFTLDGTTTVLSLTDGGNF